MRNILAILFLVVTGITAASAQGAPEAPQGAPAAVQSQGSAAPPPGPPPFALDHGQAADVEAAAKAEAAAAEARTAAIAAGAPRNPSESTDFGINGTDVVRVASPTSQQEKAAAQAYVAWQARCRPTVVVDREGLRRTQYSAPDCDLSRINTAGVR